MKFPNKVTGINNSIIPSLHLLMKIILIKPIDVISLYYASEMNNISQFSEALSCLYALNKIRLNEKKELEKC